MFLKINFEKNLKKIGIYNNLIQNFDEKEILEKRRTNKSNIIIDQKTNDKIEKIFKPLKVYGSNYYNGLSIYNLYYLLKNKKKYNLGNINYIYNDYSEKKIDYNNNDLYKFTFFITAFFLDINISNIYKFEIVDFSFYKENIEKKDFEYYIYRGVIGEIKAYNLLFNFLKGEKGIPYIFFEQIFKKIGEDINISNFIDINKKEIYIEDLTKRGIQKLLGGYLGGIIISYEKDYKMDDLEKKIGGEYDFEEIIGLIHVYTYLNFKF